jgi:hypothetical protein
MKNKIYVLNAFSLQMLDLRNNHIVVIKPISKTDVQKVLLKNPFISAVGHKDTAEIFTSQLHVLISENRTNIMLNPGDIAFVGQLTGGRLPEGATTLPEGFNIQWLLIHI